MFVGHFAVGLAAKRLAPNASLPVLLAAPQLLDIVFPIMVLAGAERVAIQPGIMDASFLDLQYIPYSHSLVATTIWSLLFATGYYLATRDRRAALVLGACVASHWVLDWIAHRPDMPLLSGDGTRVGLGLWSSIPATLAVEGALFAAGTASYVHMTRARDRRGSIGFWALITTLVAMWLGVMFSPPPPNGKSLAIAAMGGWLLLGWAWWIERHRAPA
jgi:membrane-bound metal-dependent hydrolase YbcI (DUF457 family)